MSPFKLLAAILACLLYPVAAMLNPLLSKSPLAILLLTLLVAAVGLRTSLSRNQDIFEPIKIVGFYFVLIFAIAPLGAMDLQWHYTRPFHEIVPLAALFSLGTFLAVMVGYEVGGIGTATDSRTLNREILPETGDSALRMGGFAFFGIGLVGYLILFVRAGGIGTILLSDTNRTEFFLDFGYLFWFASFMFPGAVLLFAGMKKRHGIADLLRFFPAAAVFVLFLLLQGRSRSLNALVLIAFASHYLIRRIRLTQLSGWGVALASLALFIGVARSGSVRSYAVSDPISILREILVNLPEALSNFAVIDFSRLRQVALIIDKVPALQPYDWGSSLVVFLNPWIRLVELDHLSIEPIGNRLFHLAYPHLPHMNTGILPSMQGEMLFNFPWYAAILPFFVYGFFLRVAYQRLVLSRPTLTSIILYATIMTWSAQFLLSAVGKSIFEMLIWLIPIALTGALSALVGTSPPLAQEANAPSWQDGMNDTLS